MSLLNTAKRRIAAPIRRVARGLSAASRLSAAISPFLPETVCVDVGASYYPHVKWKMFLESPNTRWVAVEPNQVNLGYLEQWHYPSRITACTTGLSRDGGTQTLFITNVDSGSSLLEPVIAPAMASRVRNHDYFFPVRPQPIDTLTLVDVIAAQSNTAPALVKLDTQGAELSILQGAQKLLAAHRIVGIESELTMLAEPLMKGSGKFWEACSYLEGLGYELLHVKPIYGPSRFGRPVGRGLTFLNECDAVFALRRDVATGLPVEYRAALAGFYLCYAFLEEVEAMLEEDAELAAWLSARGCNLARLVASIRRSAHR